MMNGIPVTRIEVKAIVCRKLKEKAGMMLAIKTSIVFASQCDTFVKCQHAIRKISAHLLTIEMLILNNPSFV